MSDPLVSVIVSTKDRRGLVVAAIEALLAQRTDGFRYEVLVVDNNSSDDTASVVRCLEQRSGGVVRYLFEGRNGVSHGRNTGIAASRGSILAFTDDDVRVPPAWLSTGVRLLLASPGLQYIGGPVTPSWAAEPPAWLTRSHWSPIAAVDYGPAPFQVPRDRVVCLISANLLIRRPALDRVGWFDPTFRRCQDRELMLRLWAAGLTGLYAPALEVTTVVPIERLTRDYHRQWHRTHGEFVARMPLRERWVHGSWVMEPASRGRFFLGVPLFEYRALLKYVGRWLRCAGSLRMEEAFAQELHLRYSLAFVLTSARLGRGGARRLVRSGRSRERQMRVT
jgi:glycosyltransferase involved in cell wall biosynthesis